MLRMSKLTDYGTVVLAHLASDGSSCVSAAEVAEASGIALPTVSKLLKSLAKAELVSNIYYHKYVALAEVFESTSCLAFYSGAQQDISQLITKLNTPGFDGLANAAQQLHDRNIQAQLNSCPFLY